MKLLTVVAQVIMIAYVIITAPIVAKAWFEPKQTVIHSELKPKPIVQKIDIIDV